MSDAPYSSYWANRPRTPFEYDVSPRLPKPRGQYRVLLNLAIIVVFFGILALAAIPLITS